jgi:hypothetical protein
MPGGAMSVDAVLAILLPHTVAVLYMLNLVFALFAFMRMQSICMTMDPFVPINCIYPILMPLLLSLCYY